MTKPGLQDSRVGLAIVTIIFYLGIGKTAGAFKEAVIAYRYGVGDVVDAFVFVTNLYAWIPGLIFSLLCSVVLPLLNRIKVSGESDREFLSEVIGLCIVIGFALSWIGYAFAPLIANSIGADPGDTGQTEIFARSLAPVVALSTVVAVLSMILLGAGRHVNTLLESLPSLFTGAVVMAWSWTSGKSLIFGLIAGLAAQAVMLFVAVLRVRSIPIPRLGFDSQAWAGLGNAAGILVVGQLLMSVVNLVDQYMAIKLGSGELSTFSYAVVSTMVANGKDLEATQCARLWAMRVFWAGVLASILSWMLADQIVTLVFKRGAFSSENAISVAEIFRAGLLQLPVYFTGVVLVQLLSSQARYRVIAMVAVGNLLVKLAGNLALVEIFGTAGLMYATALMYCTSATAFWFVTRRRAL
jgi:peptidoglycan biosynthesis protein MviN/MurJ (putative lipid II flippase)